MTVRGHLKMDERGICFFFFVSILNGSRSGVRGQARNCEDRVNVILSQTCASPFLRTRAKTIPHVEAN